MGPIVAAVSLAVCAGPALASGSGDVGSMTVEEVVAWINNNMPLVMGILGLISMIILWRVKVLRVGGLDAGARDLKPIPVIMWLFAAAATYYGLMVGAAVAAQMIANTATVVPDGQAAAPMTAKDQALITVMSSGMGALFGVGILWFVRRQAEESGTKPDWVDLPLGLGLFVVVYPLVALAGILGVWVARGFDTVTQDRLAHETLQLIVQNKGQGWNWVLIAAMIVLVPIAEELIYRVFLQSAILRIVRSRWTAVILTSLLFAAAHWTALPEGGKYAIAPIFALSVALGASYERTGRLGVPIVMHAAFNALNLAMALFFEPLSG
jgi:membrane protease YdiL (CAAX protease family)